MSADSVYFTVIIATFNSEETLARSLDSLLAQTKNSFECIVCDGLSKDSTVSIIKNYERLFKQANISFTWLSESDTGIYDAWNKGLKLAKGEYISFLGSDDIYLPDALENYNKKLNGMKYGVRPHLLYSNVDYVDGERKIRSLNGTWSWQKFKRFMCIAHVGSFHHRDYFKEYGIYDTSYKICGDYELLLRAKDQLKTEKLNKVTVKMQAGGVSNNLVTKAFKETYRAKITSGGVPKLLAKFDYLLARFKFEIKRLIGKD